MSKRYGGFQGQLRDICESGKIWNEYGCDEGLQELHKLVPKSRRSTFGILTEDFLEELLNGETRGTLKDNYDKYISEGGKNPYLPSPTKILDAMYVPANIFLFNNTELPENYKKELIELKKDIPNFYFLINKGDSYILDRFEPYGISTDFALFDYLGYNENKRTSAWYRNQKTNKVLIVENNNLFRQFLIDQTAVEPYNI